MSGAKVVEGGLLVLIGVADLLKLVDCDILGKLGGAFDGLVGWRSIDMIY